MYRKRRQSENTKHAPEEGLKPGDTRALRGTYDQLRIVLLYLRAERGHPRSRTERTPLLVLPTPPPLTPCSPPCPIKLVTSSRKRSDLSPSRATRSGTPVAIPSRAEADSGSVQTWWLCGCRTRTPLPPKGATSSFRFFSRRARRTPRSGSGVRRERSVGMVGRHSSNFEQ